MALVVFLRGVNVGGHRTFRPTILARELGHLDAVNIGAAGTELAARLPFETEIMICQGRDILRLVSENPFADEPLRPDIGHFVGVLSRRPRSAPATPICLPAGGEWLLKILGRDGRFVFGLYRRQMKAIGHLGTIDRLFGVPATSRSWSTITAIAKVLGRD